MDRQVNPAMIVLAREARGLTQTDLASMLSIPKGKMSKIEAGFISVPEQLLKELSDNLRYKQEFFYLNEDIYGMGLSGMGIIYYRRRQSIPMHLLNKIQAEMNIRRIHISKLLKSVEINNKLELPYMDIDEYNGDASKVATAVRATWRVPNGPINNLTELIESAGGVVIKCDFGTDKIDALSMPGIPPLFFINRRSLGDRLRFSLAHELGHIVMHRMSTESMEEEANKFASELLMPKHDIAPYLDYVDVKRLAKLKPYWKVAMSAMLYRSHELGKMTKRRYQYLWTQMAPFRKREPAELDIPIEDPKLLGKIINSFLNDLQYEMSQLSDLLFLKEEETRYLYIPNLKTPYLTVVK